ncbi:MAG: glycosyltransferase [Pseudomonadales bacterium]
MRIVWINKSTWKKPGPVAYMGLLNACSFAWNNLNTDFFIHGSGDDDIEADLTGYYGLKPHPLLTIHLTSKTKGLQRTIYNEALKKIAGYCDSGERVLALTREVGILPSLAKLKKRCPSLTVLHEVHDYFGSIKHLPSRGFSDFRRMVSERLVLGRIDGLICLTEYQRALYQQWLPQLPMMSIPLGSAKPDQIMTDKLEHRRQQRRVAYIGRHHRYKGSDLVLTLGQHLKDENIELTSYGGNTHYVTGLQQQAKASGLEHTLKFLPFLSPNQLNRALDQEVSLGIVPLQDTYYSRYLTCPVKALDFMAHGLPIVGSDIPSVTDVLGHCGDIVPHDNEQAYISSILRLLNDSDHYATMSQRAFNRAQAISWQSRAKKIIAFVNHKT